jgi:hypothetical protein
MSVTTRGFHGRETKSAHKLPPGHGRVATMPAGTWLSLSGSESWRLPIFAAK